MPSPTVASKRLTTQSHLRDAAKFLDLERTQGCGDLHSTIKLARKITISAYWKCQLIGWTLFNFIPLSFYAMATRGDYGGNVWSDSLFTSVKVIVLGILVSHLLRATIRKTGILKKNLFQQFFYSLVLTLLFSVIFVLLLNISSGLITELQRPGRSSLNITTYLFQGLIFAGAFLIWSLIYLVVQYIRNVRKEEQEKMSMKIQVLETEAKALRAQMNPHFIFNCLSSINHFIIQNQTEQASDYLTKFSRLIRMVLSYSEKKLIPLEDELEMLRLYLDMEKLRFKDSFGYSIIYDKKIDAGAIYIPPLLFQPFAENAIWHGLMHKKGEGRINIEVNPAGEELLNCTITDNGVGRKKAADLKEEDAARRKSVGIQITKQRLALLAGDEVKEDFYEIQDLVDEKGESVGTRVILKIKYAKFIEEIEE